MSAVVAVRILFVLGIVNAALLLTMLFSCRCVIGAQRFARITRTGAFKKFARFHCWLWWPLWISVATHAVLAFIYVGWPG